MTIRFDSEIDYPTFAEPTQASEPQIVAEEYEDDDPR